MIPTPIVLDARAMPPAPSRRTDPRAMAAIDDLIAALGAAEQALRFRSDAAAWAAGELIDAALTKAGVR